MEGSGLLNMLYLEIWSDNPPDFLQQPRTQQHHSYTLRPAVSCLTIRLNGTILSCFVSK